jgi:hypothetical protein
MVKRTKSNWRRGLPPTSKTFRPYAIALGQIALAWNELHQALALLFCNVMGGGFVNQFLAVWNAIKNDRAQRAILKAAAHGNINSGMPPERADRLFRDIEWINARANEIEDARDDALHSPLFAADETQRAIPLTGLGHPRAEKLLLRRNLLAEFRWCRDSARTLTEFAYALDAAAGGLGPPWPDRPKMPNRGETNTQRRPPPTPPIEPSRPPRSSRA